MFLAIVVLKLAINISRYFKCRRYLDRYHKWLADPIWELVEHRGQVIDLFKQANVEDEDPMTNKLENARYLYKFTVLSGSSA